MVSAVPAAGELVAVSAALLVALVPEAAEDPPQALTVIASRAAAAAATNGPRPRRPGGFTSAEFCMVLLWLNATCPISDRPGLLDLKSEPPGGGAGCHCVSNV